jgi:hypothetical protein
MQSRTRISKQWIENSSLDKQRGQKEQWHCQQREDQNRNADDKDNTDYHSEKKIGEIDLHNLNVSDRCVTTE